MSLGPYTDSISGSAGSTDIETMLQMLYLKFTGVRRDEDLYKSFIGKQVESARNVMSQPEAVFQRHPGRRPCTTTARGWRGRRARTISPS